MVSEHIIFWTPIECTLLTKLRWCVNSAWGQTNDKPMINLHRASSFGPQIVFTVPSECEKMPPWGMVSKTPWCFVVEIFVGLSCQKNSVGFWCYKLREVSGDEKCWDNSALHVCSFAVSGIKMELNSSLVGMRLFPFIFESKWFSPIIWRNMVGNLNYLKTKRSVIRDRDPIIMDVSTCVYPYQVVDYWFARLTAFWRKRFYGYAWCSFSMRL